MPSSDLMGKLSIFLREIWVENVSHGLLHHTDVTDFVVLSVFSKKRTEDASNG